MKSSRCLLFAALLGISLGLAGSTGKSATQQRKPWRGCWWPSVVVEHPPAPPAPPVPPVPPVPPAPPVPPVPPVPPAPAAHVPPPAVQPGLSAQPVVVTSRPVAAPPQAITTPLPNSILAWDAEVKTIEVHEGDPQGHLAFNFTNVSPDNVVILNVKPGCGCTTAQLPPLPWTNAPGADGRIGVTINVHGTAPLYKNLTVTTDKGIKNLNFHVNILPVVLPQLTEADRARDLQIAQTNRQAVLQGECVICHVKQGEGKYGKPLYDADCGICHDGPRRSTLVPDLHALKTPTSLEFWRTWILHGKPGSLMPAFSTTEGGPLNDMQIATLAQYLTTTLAPRPAPRPVMTNAVPVPPPAPASATPLKTP